MRLERRIQCAGAIAAIHTFFVKLKFNDFQQTILERVYPQIDSDILSQLISECFQRKRIPMRLFGIGIKLKQDKAYEMVQFPLSFNDLSV